MKDKGIVVYVFKVGLGPSSEEESGVTNAVQNNHRIQCLRLVETGVLP